MQNKSEEEEEEGERKGEKKRTFPGLTNAERIHSTVTRKMTFLFCFFRVPSFPKWMKKNNLFMNQWRNLSMVPKMKGNSIRCQIKKLSSFTDFLYRTHSFPIFEHFPFSSLFKPCESSLSPRRPSYPPPPPLFFFLFWPRKFFAYPSKGKEEEKKTLAASHRQCLIPPKIASLK